MSAVKNFYHDQICEGMRKANEEQDTDQMIAEYEERKNAILSSNIPAFFGPDPSMF